MPEYYLIPILDSEKIGKRRDKIAGEVKKKARQEAKRLAILYIQDFKEVKMQ
jgi:hypothetical protein